MKSFRKVMELDSTEAIKSAVEVGLGVGFVSRWAIRKELDLGALKATQVHGLKVTRRFTLISRTGPEPKGLAGAFHAFAHFLGMPWLHNRRSGILFGVGDDAAYISAHIASRNRELREAAPALPRDAEWQSGFSDRVPA